MLTRPDSADFQFTSNRSITTRGLALWEEQLAYHLVILGIEKAKAFDKTPPQPRNLSKTFFHHFLVEDAQLIHITVNQSIDCQIPVDQIFKNIHFSLSHFLLTSVKRPLPNELLVSHLCGVVPRTQMVWVGDGKIRALFFLKTFWAKYLGMLCAL